MRILELHSNAQRAKLLAVPARLGGVGVGNAEERDMSTGSGPDKHRVGWIGLGKMGFPSASDLPPKGSR
jgi:hypothetical protein